MTSVFQLNLSHEMGDETVLIYPTLIQTGNSLILFDACLPHQINQLEKELQKHNRSIMDLTHVFISHQDHDHVGSLAAIKNKNMNIEIITNQLEEPYISGKKASLRIIQAEEFNENLTGEELKWGESFVQYLKTIKPCKIDKTFTGESFYLDEDIMVINTPGHTPGHSSLFIKSINTLIAGDALAVENNTLCIANPQFTLDMHTCKKTVKEIFQLRPDNILCYHGGLVDNRQNAEMKDLIDRIEI